MIESFRHKGLRLFFEKGDTSKIPSQQTPKIRRILTRLHAAASIQDLNYSGAGLHPLKGDLSGFWAVTVTGNYRIIFRFEEGKVLDVDYIDYH